MSKASRIAAWERKQGIVKSGPDMTEVYAALNIPDPRQAPDIAASSTGTTHWVRYIPGRGMFSYCSHTQLDTIVDSTTPTCKRCRRMSDAELSFYRTIEGLARMAELHAEE